MVEVVAVRNVSQRLCRAYSCHACPTGAGRFSGCAVMPCDRRALLWADLPRDAVCDPACSPQQRASIFFPAAAPLLAQQQDRRTPSSACAAA
jgi:hypothetical protein